MDILPEKIALLTKKVSSPRILLWIPLLKNLVKEEAASLFVLQNDSDFDLEENDIIEKGHDIQDFTGPSCLGEDQVVLIADTPDHLDSYQVKEIRTRYGCFLGGINGISLAEQIDWAKKAKVNFLICDLLPAEVEPVLTAQDFEYFLQLSIFLPHGDIDDFIPTQSSDAPSFCFITDSKSNCNHTEIDDIYLKTFHQSKDFKIVEISELASIEKIYKALNFADGTRFIVSNLPASLSHFIADFCRTHSIDLKILKRPPHYSIERFFLSYNQLELRLFFDQNKEFSIRKKFKSLFEKEISQPQPASLSKQKDKFPDSISQTLTDLGVLKCPRRLQASNSLRAIRETQKSQYHLSLQKEAFEHVNPFTASERTLRFHFLYNAITHFRLIHKTEQQEPNLHEFLFHYAKEVIALFLEEETSDPLVNSFTRIIGSEESLFHNAIYSQLQTNLLFQDKIRLIRLVCFSILSFGKENQRKTKFLLSLQNLNIEVEFKLLFALYTKDPKWISENFHKLYGSSDKLRFYKFFNFCLLNHLPSPGNLKLFLEKWFQESKQELPPVIFEKTDILQSILSPDKKSFSAKEVSYLDETLDYPFLFKCVIHCLLHKKLTLAEKITTSMNAKDISRYSQVTLLMILCTNLLLNNKDEASVLAGKISTQKGKINLSAIEPYFFAQIFSILAAQSKKETYLSNAREICQKFSDHSNDISPFIFAAIEENTIQPESIEEVLKLLDTSVYRFL